MIRAVVFDLDDTLYPEAEFAASGFFKAACVLENTYGMKDAFEKIMVQFQKDRTEVFGALCREEGLPEKAEQDAVKAYRENKPEKLDFYPKTKEVLLFLRRKGMKLGIITDGRPFSQRAKIEALGVERFVDEIIVTDEIGREFRKPHPRSFEIMAQKLGVCAEEMIYVGDNPVKDFAIKKFLPVRTVRVLSGGLYQNGELLYGIQPDFTVDSLEKLKEDAFYA